MIVRRAAAGPSPFAVVATFAAIAGGALALAHQSPRWLPPLRTNPRGAKRRRRPPPPPPPPPRRRRRSSAMQKAIEACNAFGTCYEAKRDRAGRRRRCRETFDNKGQAVEALDDALDGMLTRYLDRADDGSQVLRDLEEVAEDRRGRRRRFPTWWHAAAWAAPSSRRWREFDPGRLAVISEALREALTIGGGEEPLPLEFPEQTRRLWDADERRDQCRTQVRDQAAEERARRRAPLPALADVPF